MTKEQCCCDERLQRAPILQVAASLTLEPVSKHTVLHTIVHQIVLLNKERKWIRENTRDIQNKSLVNMTSRAGAVIFACEPLHLTALEGWQISYRQTVTDLSDEDVHKGIRYYRGLVRQNRIEQKMDPRIPTG